MNIQNNHVYLSTGAVVDFDQIGNIIYESKGSGMKIREFLQNEPEYLGWDSESIESLIEFIESDFFSKS